MKFKLLTLAALLGNFFVTYAMEKPKTATIKIANATMLKSRLARVGGRGLVKQVDIVAQLAEQEKTPKEVAQAIADAIEEYNKYLDTRPDPLARELEKALFSNRKKIFHAFFEDHPAAFQELEKNGF